jgi:hypothetical protein
MLTVFPLIAILLDVPLFSDVRRNPSVQYTQSTATILKRGTIYAVIGTGTFFPFLSIGFLLQDIIPFPQSYALSIMSWIVGCGLIGAGALRLIQTRQSDSTQGLRTILRIDHEQSKVTIIKTIVLALIVFAWLYLLTLLANLGFILDLRCFLPGLHDLTLLQAILVPYYFAGFLIYYLIEGAWFTGIMLPRSSGTWTRVQIEWSAATVIAKCLPYLILIAIEFVGGLLAGAPVLPGMIGFSWLFFYAFAPWFAMCMVITMFAYRMTNTRWLGAIINAVLCAWLLATILPLS